MLEFAPPSIVVIKGGCKGAVSLILVWGTQNQVTHLKGGYIYVYVYHLYNFWNGQFRKFESPRGFIFFKSENILKHRYFPFLNVIWTFKPYQKVKKSQN